jgi:hypothetical protein
MMTLNVSRQSSNVLYNHLFHSLILFNRLILFYERILKTEQFHLLQNGIAFAFANQRAEKQTINTRACVLDGKWINIIYAIRRLLETVRVRGRD